MTLERVVEHVQHGRATSDGAGVKIRRWAGFENPRFSPFLMIDELRSSSPDDYIGGFPMHPHRGIETLTYMRQGHFRHNDHLGNVGELKTGGAQWMASGRGIVHSEMPVMDDGRLHGFQIWINQPACCKMNPATYLDCHTEMIPELNKKDLGLLRVIAGTVSANGHTLKGPVQGTGVPLSVSDWHAATAGQSLVVATDNTTHMMMVFCYFGSMTIGQRVLKEGELAFLSSGEQVTLVATDATTAAKCDGGAGGNVCEALVFSGKKIDEPVVHSGSFVMNTREEIEQAYEDFHSGKFKTYV